jgi:hypothetical protein
MKYQVIVRATYEEVYEVEADNPKDAEAKSVEADCVSSENVWNETMSIRPADRRDS